MNPRCSHFSDCGGCSQQDKEYSRQVEEKKDILNSVPGIDKPDFIPSPEVFGFRNKMEFSFEGENLGLHRRGAFDKVVNLTECPVFADWTGNFLQKVREFASRRNLPYYRRRENEGLLRFLILKESKFTGENMAILVINDTGFKYTKEWGEVVEKYMPGRSSAVIGYKTTLGDSAFTENFEIVGGSGRMKVKIGDIPLELSPYSFFQPNSYQVENIYSLIRSKLEGKSKILDLYSGIGSIPFYLAEPGRHIRGVESSESCISDAAYNLQKIAPKGKIEFTAGKVRPFLAECGELYDGVVLDPPRGGISYRVFKHINRIAKRTDEPVKVIYVSCSIKNFLQDAKYITNELGWSLQSLTGVDQFVHTPHLETVAEFEI